MTTTYTLISGANSGLGLATAQRLAREHGHHVIVGSRIAEAGAKVAEQIVAEGFQASSVQLDLNSDDSINAAVKLISEKFGRLDVLINNAGILIDGTPAAGTTRELFTKTFNANLIGHAVLTEALLPLLRKAENPCLVFVSSRMGSIELSKDRSTPYYPIDYKAYDASKAALNMLAVQYSRVLDDVKAKVNVVCPQLVASNLSPFVQQYGAPAYDCAKHVVDLAIIGKDGPIETFSDKDGPIPW